MNPRRRQASIARLLVLIVLTVACIWMLYRVFIGIPPAPAPTVTTLD